MPRGWSMSRYGNVKVWAGPSWIMGDASEILPLWPPRASHKRSGIWAGTSLSGPALPPAESMRL